MGRIISKALQDETFKHQLIVDPTAVLKAGGVEIPDGITVKVVADTESVRHIALPAMGKGELADSELEAVAGGAVVDCIFECGWGKGR